MFSQTLRRAKTVILSWDLRSIGVTSSAGEEGATAVAANLARLMARSGKRVLLVEGAGASSATAECGRRPATEQFGAEARPVPRAVSDERSGLHVLAIDEATEASWWERVNTLVVESAGNYDLVVVDLPPVGCGAEFRMAAQKLQGLLMVLRWGSAELDQVRRSLDLSGGVRCKFIGAVLNMVDERLIGLYGDKLWRAEADLAARRRSFHGSGAAERASVVRT
jgi:succinoglycan biosynthesis transport protein ExoP